MGIRIRDLWPCDINRGGGVPVCIFVWCFSSFDFQLTWISLSLLDWGCTVPNTYIHLFVYPKQPPTNTEKKPNNHACRPRIRDRQREIRRLLHQGRTGASAGAVSTVPACIHPDPTNYGLCINAYILSYVPGIVMISAVLTDCWLHI